MKKIQSLLIYVILILALISILGISGIINLTGRSWMGSGLTALGFGIVLIFFGEYKPHFLFAGSFAFLLGNYLFIIDKFEIIKGKPIILPALFLITGLSVLILYIEKTSQRKYLYSSIILISSGIISVFYFGSLNLVKIFYYLFEIIKIYWLLAAIILLIVFIISRKKDYE